MKPLLLALALAAPLAGAEAKCSIRVGDPLITQRYQECNTRTFLSYLYNDLVTPFSFTCAKKLSATCQKENCANPQTEEETQHCLGSYVQVLNECTQQIDDAARMARCKDTKTWPVAGYSIAPGRPVVAPDAPVDEIVPVTVEPLPEEAFQVIRRTTQTSQSSRRR